MNSSETLYKRAYDLHYKVKDLHAARELYSRLVRTFPNTSEARYAKSQLENISQISNSKGEAALSPSPRMPYFPRRSLLSTVDFIPGRTITDNMGVVTAEYVTGMNVLKDIASGLRDFVGGRSGSWQNSLRTAREKCLQELYDSASELGANAVIGVRLDYSELTGGGKSMLFLVASGTAVKLADADG